MFRFKLHGIVALVFACSHSSEEERPAPKKSKPQPIAPVAKAPPKVPEKPEPPPAPAHCSWSIHESSIALAKNIAPPEGFRRIKAPDGSFGAWLRQLPLKPGRPKVRLYNGKLKPFQGAQHSVVDIDVGKKDLQQCADAVMRLRAEYQWSNKQRDKICFRFTSGHKVSWEKWSKGYRPKIRNNNVSFKKTARAKSDYLTFKSYLERIFMYAGTASLSKELLRVSDPTKIEIGDVFIQGGFPGHAVLVVDVVENTKGERRFMLAQSYMPAQQIHVLKSPKGDDPWYPAVATQDLETPEWRFKRSDLMRFSEAGCPTIR